MKSNLIFCSALLCLLFSCKKNEIKETTATDSTSQTSKDTISENKDVPNFVDDFKKNKDEKAFLTSLYKKVNQEAKTSTGAPYKLLKTEELKLNGSNNPVTLVYVDEIDGSMSSWPWKSLFVLDNSGNVLSTYETEKYEPVAIFENQAPLLMVTEQTSKGDGLHHFLGIENNKIKEYLNTHGWSLLTIYGGYTPKVLPFTLEDINNDKQKDIVFTGKKKNMPVKLSFAWDANKKDFEPKDSLNVAP